MTFTVSLDTMPAAAHHWCASFALSPSWPCERCRRCAPPPRGHGRRRDGRIVPWMRCRHDRGGGRPCRDRGRSSPRGTQTCAGSRECAPRPARRDRVACASAGRDRSSARSPACGLERRTARCAARQLRTARAGGGSWTALRTSLGVRQDGAGTAYPVPTEAGDLRRSGACEQQQPDRGDSLSCPPHDRGRSPGASVRQPTRTARAVWSCSGVCHDRDSSPVDGNAPQFRLAHHDGEYRQCPVGVDRVTPLMESNQRRTSVARDLPRQRMATEEGHEVSIDQCERLPLPRGRLPPSSVAAHELLSRNRRRAGAASRSSLAAATACSTAFSRACGGSDLVYRSEDDRSQCPSLSGSPLGRRRSFLPFLGDLQAEGWQVLVEDGQGGSSGFLFLAEFATNCPFVDGGVDAHGRVSVVCYLRRRSFLGNEAAAVST